MPGPKPAFLNISQHGESALCPLCTWLQAWTVDLPPLTPGRVYVVHWYSPRTPGTGWSFSLPPPSPHIWPFFYMQYLSLLLFCHSSGVCLRVPSLSGLPREWRMTGWKCQLCGLMFEEREESQWESDMRGGQPVALQCHSSVGASAQGDATSAAESLEGMLQSQEHAKLLPTPTGDQHPLHILLMSVGWKWDL